MVFNLFERLSGKKVEVPEVDTSSKSASNEEIPKFFRDGRGLPEKVKARLSEIASRLKEIDDLVKRSLGTKNLLEEHIRLVKEKRTLLQSEYRPVNRPIVENEKGGVSFSEKPVHELPYDDLMRETALPPEHARRESSNFDMAIASGYIALKEKAQSIIRRLKEVTLATTERLPEQRRLFFQSLDLKKRDVVFLAIAGGLGLIAGANNIYERLNQNNQEQTAGFSDAEIDDEALVANADQDTGIDAGPQDTSSYEESGIYDTAQDNFVASAPVANQEKITQNNILTVDAQEGEGLISALKRLGLDWQTATRITGAVAANNHVALDAYQTLPQTKINLDELSLSAKDKASARAAINKTAEATVTPSTPAEKQAAANYKDNIVQNTFEKQQQPVEVNAAAAEAEFTEMRLAEGVNDLELQKEIAKNIAGCFKEIIVGNFVKIGKFRDYDINLLQDINDPDILLSLVNRLQQEHAKGKRVFSRQDIIAKLVEVKSIYNSSAANTTDKRGAEKALLSAVPLEVSALLQEQTREYIVRAKIADYVIENEDQERFQDKSDVNNFISSLLVKLNGYDLKSINYGLIESFDQINNFKKI